MDLPEMGPDKYNVMVEEIGSCETVGGRCYKVQNCHDDERDDASSEDEIPEADLNVLSDYKRGKEYEDEHGGRQSNSEPNITNQGITRNQILNRNSRRRLKFILQQDPWRSKMGWFSVMMGLTHPEAVLSWVEQETVDAEKVVGHVAEEIPSIGQTRIDDRNEAVNDDGTLGVPVLMGLAGSVRLLRRRLQGSPIHAHHSTKMEKSLSSKIN